MCEEVQLGLHTNDVLKALVTVVNTLNCVVRTDTHQLVRYSIGHFVPEGIHEPNSLFHRIVFDGRLHMYVCMYVCI